MIFELFALSIYCCVGAEPEKLEPQHASFPASTHFSLLINEHNDIALKITDEKAVGKFAVHTADTFCDWTYYLASDGRQWHTEVKERGFGSGIFHWGDAQHPAVLPLIGYELESALRTTFAWGKVYELYAVASNGVKTNTLKFRLDASELNPSANKGKNQGAFNFKINLINKDQQPWIKITVTNITSTDADWHEGQVLDMFGFALRLTDKNGLAACYRTIYFNWSILKTRKLKPNEKVFYEMSLDKWSDSANVTLERSRYIEGIPAETYSPTYSLDIETNDPRQKQSADWHNNYARMNFLVLVKECD